MIGLFGSKAPKQKPNFSEIAMVLGGGLRELGGSQGAMNGAMGYVQGNRDRLAQLAQQEQQKQRMQSLLSQVGGGKSNPEMELAMLLNGSELGKNLATKFGKPETFQHGNRVGSLGAGGQFSTYDLGASNADMNATLGHQVDMRGQDITEQNNLATQELGLGKLEEMIRSNQASEALTGYSNRTGRMNAETAREKAVYDMTKPPDVEKLTPYQAEKLAMEKTEFELEQKAQKEAERQAESQRISNLENIERMLAGDLRGGFQGAYGASNWMRKVPGVPAATAGGILDEITGPQTLDALANMKGVPSDRDIDLVKGAATVLNNPNVSDEEATRALQKMYVSLGGDPRTIGLQPSQTDLKPGDVVDGWRFVGGDPAKRESWSR